MPVKRIEMCVHGVPVAKPRQTRRDKWMKRPCVMRYRGWADDARKELAKITIPKTFLPFALFAKAFFPIPKGKKKKIRQGAYHRVKPDADNVLKAICDALFPGNDAMVSHVSLIKNYDDGAGERVELEIYFSEER